MPIDGKIQLDPNQRRFGLPTDSVVGSGVGDPHAGGKSAKPGFLNPKVVDSRPDSGGPALDGRTDPHATNIGPSSTETAGWTGKSVGKAAAQK